MDEFSGCSDVLIWQILGEVHDMDDDYLVEEIMHLDYTSDSNIESIVNNFVITGILQKKDRDSLVGFYILSWHDVDLED